MKKFYFVAVLATLALLCGCSKMVEEGNGVEVAKSELSIGLPIGVSRTAMNDEGKASWIEGDTFTLWAQNRTGGFAINGAEFQMMYYWHSAQSAVFTANTNTLAEGSYTYYAVSPQPESITNRKVTYTLPAEQQGKVVNCAYDFMVATPITTDALSTEKINDLSLEFNHKTHLLKLVIPKGGNPLNEPIKQVVFTFPTIVTGKITIDATTPTANPMVNSGSKQLIINIPEGLDEGDVAWGRILPGHISGAVAYYTISTIGERSTTRTFNLSKECKGGHITPLSLPVPTPIPPTILRFKVGNNNLGEAVQKVSIYDYNGNLLQAFSVNSSNTYDLVQHGIYEEGKFQTYAGKTFTVRFESQNAIVEQKITIPSTIAKNEVNTLAAVDVPYLFFEDFTSIHTSFDKDDARVDNLMEADGMLLNDYMSVAGWNGAHIRGVAGKSVRVNVRHECTVAGTRSNGRLDTPTIKNLKSGATVSLKVEFDMGAYANSGFGKNNEIFCIAGIHTKPEDKTINGKADTDTQFDDYSRIPPLFDRVCLTTGYITQKCNDNSFGDAFDYYSFVANGCTSATRLCWVPCCVQKETFWANNAHYYIYLDNIKVSIAQ
jgi:hypothetical protein